jgi:nucleoside-diphosphate-sugar epimerase
MRKILVTGALGQIGCELVAALTRAYGTQAIIATDIRTHPPGSGRKVRHENLDCTKLDQLQDVVRKHDVGTIYHLAALLSAVAEQKPQIAWKVNMASVYNVLEAARQHDCAVFFPSSIAAFGPTTPRDATPQVTIQRPTGMYGITKVSGEMLCDYYHARFGTDTRGLRLPGLISHTAPPGGGTTDYAVDIFHHAVRYGRYSCFLKADTRLDMMYMPDATRAMIELMEADASSLKHRNAFNVTALNFTPEELAAAISKHISGFKISYEIDPVRQAIADSWPHSLDDTAARQEWAWSPTFDLESMTRDMIAHIVEKAQRAS